MAEQQHVVVINDTEEILELFEEILSGMGHRVSRMAYTPMDGSQIASLKPDLVVIDFVIGGREYEGWQLIQKLRMRRETQDLPIVACTAAVRMVREMEGQLAAQNVRVIFKPFRIDDFEHAIREMLAAL